MEKIRDQLKKDREIGKENETLINSKPEQEDLLIRYKGEVQKRENEIQQMHRA